MTAMRWALMLLAAGAVAAGLVVSMKGADEAAPVAVVHAAVPALPLTLPQLAPVAASASSVPAVAPVLTVAPASPPVGSEGYGPHIDRAQAGDDLAAVWRAVQWLQLCAANGPQRLGFERARDQGVEPQVMTLLMTVADADARRCQTVTAQHRALLPELALRAMRGGEPLAASAYADAVSPHDLSATQRLEVADALRRDASAGALGLHAAVQADEAWGLSTEERLGYLAALKLLADEPGGFNIVGSLLKLGDARFSAPPTPEQQATAQRIGQQIVARLHASEQP